MSNKSRSWVRIPVLVLLALLLTSLVGCVTGTPAAPAAEPEAAEPPEAEEPAEEEITLVFSDWHLTEPHWEVSLMEALDAYQEEHPNVNIELDYVSYAEKDTKYATEISAGAGPDVFHIHAYSLRSFIERDLLHDLTPFVEQEGGEEYLSAWYPATLELTREDGTYYALPGDFMSMVLFYNANHFEEAGLDPSQPPATWSEFLEAAQALTRDTDGDGQIDRWGFGTLGAIAPGFELRFTPILFSHGGAYLNEDNTCSALHLPGSKAAFEFFVELFTEHEVIPPGVTAQNAGTVREQMANEQVSMLLGSGWTPPIVDSVNPDLNAPEILEAAPVPVQEGTEPEFRTTAWLSAWGMNPNTEHPEAAWELMKFITSQEMEQKWFDDARVLSSREDVSGEYQALLEDKFAGIIADQLTEAQFVPQIGEWPQIIETINTAAQAGFTGDMEPLAALEQAHTEINNLLADRRGEGVTCPEF